MANIMEVSSDEESFFDVNLESPKAEKKCISTSSPKIPSSNGTNQSIPTASAVSSTIVRPGQIYH